MLESIILMVLGLAIIAGGYALKHLHDSIKSYSKEYGAEVAKIEAAASNIAEIERQIEARTRASEKVKYKFSDISENRKILREKIEELSYAINLPASLFISCIQNDNETDRMDLNPNDCTDIRDSIHRARVLADIYFPEISSPVDLYFIKVTNVLYKKTSEKLATQDVTDVISDCEALNTKLRKICSSVAITIEQGE